MSRERAESDKADSCFSLHRPSLPGGRSTSRLKACGFAKMSVRNRGCNRRSKTAGHELGRSREGSRRSCFARREAVSPARPLLTRLCFLLLLVLPLEHIDAPLGGLPQPPLCLRAATLAVAIVVVVIVERRHGGRLVPRVQRLYPEVEFDQCLRFVCQRLRRTRRWKARSLSRILLLSAPSNYSRRKSSRQGGARRGPTKG